MYSVYFPTISMKCGTWKGKIQLKRSIRHLLLQSGSGQDASGHLPVRVTRCHTPMCESHLVTRGTGCDTWRVCLWSQDLHLVTGRIVSQGLECPDVPPGPNGFLDLKLRRKGRVDGCGSSSEVRQATHVKRPGSSTWLSCFRVPAHWPLLHVFLLSHNLLSCHFTFNKGQ